LEQDDDSNPELEAAKRALSKKLAKKSDHDRQKLVAFLMRRGFSYDIVKKAMQDEEV